MTLGLAGVLEHLVFYPSVVFVAVLGLSHSALPSVATASPRVPEETGDGKDVRVLAHAGGVLLVVGEGSAYTEEAP